MKITIGRKIAFPFFVMFILIVGVAGITYQGFKKVTATLDNMQLETVKRGSAGNLRFNITQLLMASNDYIITEKDYYKHEFNRLNLIVDDFYKQFIQLQLTDEELQLTAKIKKDLDSIRTISAKIFSIPHPRQSPEAWTLMETMDYRFGEDVNSKTTLIFDGISRRIEEQRIQASADKVSVANTIYLVTFFTIVISLIVSYLTVHRISRPIITLTKAANSIANGDYSHRVVVKTHDEVALLAKSFNIMAESIQQSQSALEESKRFTESIIEAEPECVKVIGLDGTLLSINPAGLRMIEADSPEQVIGKSLYPLVVPEHRQAFQDLTQRVRMGAEGTLQYEILGRKGTRRWLETHAVPLRDETGRVSGNLGITRDITERKYAEEELLKISTAIEQTADCVVITDRDGIIQYVNTAFTKIFGYTKEEALGKTPRILKSGLHPPQFYETLWETILFGEVFTATFINKRKDGELIYEVKTITPIKDKEGHITHFVSTAKEITEQRRAQEAMRKKEEHHKAVIENIFKFIPEGVLVLTESLNLLKQNKAFDDIVQKYAPLLEYTEEELAEMIIHQLRSKIVIGDSKEIHIGKNDQLITGISGRDELILQFNTARMFLAAEEEEEEASIIVSLLDVTERKRSEEALRESEAKFRKLISSLPDAVLVVNTEGRIVYCNENATKIFDYDYDEMLSRTVEDLMPKRFREGHKAFHSIYFSEPKGRPMGDGMELFALRKDGSEFPTEIMLEPVEIHNNLFILTIVRDITERKRAKQEIISQKNKFAQLFENSPIAIALLDDQDKVVVINESFSALFGYYQEEIRGKSLTDLIVPPELKEEAESYSDQTRAGNQINKESYRKKKDDTLVCVQIVGVPVIVNDKTVGLYGMYVDLTQRKDAEEKMKSAKELAEQSDRLKTEFLAQMSHEIRTPINVISGNVDYLNQSFSENMDADARDCFDGIDLASKRIIRTIDLILNVAELQTSGYKPQFVKVDLSSGVLKKLYLEHQLLAKQKGLELIYKSEDENVEVTADEYSITQVFANLIDNAIKYTKKGKVEILLDKNISGNIMVEIKDTGIGIRKEFLPKIFEPFVQEEQGFTRSYDGNGLGLALVKNYCDINNAAIEVESEKNVGSTFRVIFK